MDGKLENILKYIPPDKALAVRGLCRAFSDGGACVSEIRLRAGAPMSVTADGRNIFSFGGCVITSSEGELAETLGRLCEDSVHTYAETIREGYVFLSGGYRVGVCGTARSEGEKVVGVYSVSSLCIRIPHAITGVCGGLLSEIRTGGELMPTLIFSPPGVGKTTLLRDVAYCVSRGGDALRTCIIDTRGEIYQDELFADCLCDVLTGYPRAKGMEIAARTLSSQVIVCDEIGTGEESRAILSVQNCGVPLIASAHAESMDGLMRRPNIKMLLDAGVFSYCVGISRLGGGYALDVHRV